MIEVETEAESWTNALADAEHLCVRAAKAALDGRAGQSVAILLTDDATLRDLNARFRQKDTPTNVLSFPAAANPMNHLGDVALAFGVCAAEAQAQGKSLSDHLSHLVAHGVLHLLGYDHETDADAEVMETQERTVLAPLGIPDPYAERPTP